MEHFRLFGKKIIAAGSNYKSAALAKLPKEPILFLKPSSSYLEPGNSIKAPAGCKDLQQEVELAVVIGKRIDKGSNGKMLDYVAGYALALDMTANDILIKARKYGLPWFLAKGFDGSCPISEMIPKDALPNPQNVDIWCKVNGLLVQRDNTSSMIFSISQLLLFASQFVTMEPGDVLLTGTPPGNCSVSPGDEIECGLGDGLIKSTFYVDKESDNRKSVSHNVINQVAFTNYTRI